MSNRIALFAAAVAFAMPVGTAQTPAPAKDTPKPAVSAPTLSIGDKAPALNVEKWVKGAPVASFEKGKVYMVEFWATWCGPCIASMPHITELQKKYRDQGLTIIGVSSTDTRGNTLEKVEEMVREKGDGMGYSVAWDKERETSGAFMKASNQRGIPCSFLVDKNGMIAYIGHPKQIDETLASVMTGKHDIAALAAKYKADLEKQAKAAPLQKALNTAFGEKDWATVLKACDDLIALDPKQYGGMATTKFRVYIAELKELDKASAVAQAYLDGPGKDDDRGLNMMAWTIVDPDMEIARRDLPLALKLALRANEITKDKSAEVLDTLARVHFSQGDIQKAIDVQTKAVAINDKLGTALQEYKDALAKKAKG